MDSERRQSFRWKSEPDTSLTKGVLHSQRGDVEVPLYDRSRLGFGILISPDCKNQVKLGEEIAFTIDGSSSLVRVAHLSLKEEGLVVGLDVIRELPSPLRRNHGRRRRAKSIHSSLPFRICLYGAVILVIGLMAPWNYLYSAIESGKLAALLAPPREEPATRLLPPPGEQDRQVYLANSFFLLNQLRSTQRRHHLQLSDSQQREIGRMLEETAASMESVFQQRASLGDAAWTEAALDILLASALEIEAELTEQQVDQWRQMMNLSIPPAPAVEASS